MVHSNQRQQAIIHRLCNCFIARLFTVTLTHVLWKTRYGRCSVDQSDESYSTVAITITYTCTWSELALLFHSLRMRSSSRRWFEAITSTKTHMGRCYWRDITLPEREETKAIPMLLLSRVAAQTSLVADTFDADSITLDHRQC